MYSWVTGAILVILTASGLLPGRPETPARADATNISNRNATAVRNKPTVASVILAKQPPSDHRE